MPVYEVLLSRAARKELDALPALVHSKIIEEITRLSTMPRPNTVAKSLKDIKMPSEYGSVITGSFMK